MRARVKATGEIVEVDFYMETKRGKMFGEVTDSKRLCKPDSSYRKFYQDEIEFLSYEDTPDYWTRLKHQYAGMAMQGILSNEDYCQYLVDRIQDGGLADSVARCAKDFATALVEKLKNE